MSSDGRQTVLANPGIGQMGSVIRAPIFPTAPFIPTDPNSSTLTRIYGLVVEPTYTLGSTLTLSWKFGIPGTIVSWNGGAFNTAAGNALPIGVRPLDTFSVKFSTSTKENVTTEPVIASTILGTGENPGQVGAYGYLVNAGGTFNVDVTPFLANLRIFMTLTVLEYRAGTNYQLFQQIFGGVQS
jgi:hypothetical protein